MTAPRAWTQRCNPVALKQMSSSEVVTLAANSLAASQLLLAVEVMQLAVDNF